jgi:hypothetical protein
MTNSKTGKRQVYMLFAIILVILFLAQIYPIYSLVNRVEPIILGMPFGMFWLVLMCLLQFGTLLVLYIWEYGKGG